MNAERRLVINADGEAYAEEVTRTPVLGLDKLIQREIKIGLLVLPSLTPDTLLMYDGARFTAFRRIFRLTLHTVWGPIESVVSGKRRTVISPVFNREPSRDNLILRDVAWEVPKDMILCFVAHRLRGGAPLVTYDHRENLFTLNAGHHTEGIYGLLAFDAKTGVSYRLPLPNTHDNGTLCTGRLASVNGYGWTTAMGVFGSWTENRWNSDLIGATRDRYKDLIRFNPDDMTQIPTEDPWQKLCFKTSTGWVPSPMVEEALKYLK